MQGNVPAQFSVLRIRRNSALAIFHAGYCTAHLSPHGRLAKVVNATVLQHEPSFVPRPHPRALLLQPARARMPPSGTGAQQRDDHAGAMHTLAAAIWARDASDSLRCHDKSAGGLWSKSPARLVRVRVSKDALIGRVVLERLHDNLIRHDPARTSGSGADVRKHSQREHGLMTTEIFRKMDIRRGTCACFCLQARVVGGGGS